MEDNGAHSFTEGMDWNRDSQPKGINNEEPNHVAFLLDRGYEPVNGSGRFYRKGGVFIAFEEGYNRSTILRVHPLRTEVFKQKHPFNVVYRGNNPWKDMAFAELLWRNLGLHIEKRKKSPDVDVDVDEMIDDMELLLRF